MHLALDLQAPRSIFHAFHWPFALVLERIQDIGGAGVDNYPSTFDFDTWLMLQHKTFKACKLP